LIKLARLRRAMAADGTDSSGGSVSAITTVPKRASRATFAIAPR